MADNEQYIYVKPHPDMGEKVALWEVNDRHPENEAGEREVFVAGQKSEPVQAARTGKVLEALKDNRLVETSAGGKAKKADTTGAGGGDTTNPLAPKANENPETTPANGQG